MTDTNTTEAPTELVPIEEQSRQTYYAAGILRWLQDNKGQLFAATELARWPSMYDATDYFGDEMLLSCSLEFLEQLGALRRYPDRYGPTMYAATAVDLGELSNRYGSSPFAKAHVFGSGWIRETLVAVTADQENSDTPAERAQISDHTTADEWEPLQLQSSPDAEETLKEIEENVEKIAADNGFSATFPQERDNIVENARLSVQQAKNGIITRAQVRQNFIAAGRWIAEKFSGSALAALGDGLVKLAFRLLDL